LEQHRTLNLTLHDISGRGIDRSRVYLSKVAGWKLPTSNWEKLKDVQRIRNLFSHASGYIPKTDLEEISRVVKRGKFLSIQSLARDRILVESGYLEHFLSLAQSYFGDLAKENAPVPTLPTDN
jgi:nitrogen fixation protein